MGSSQPQVELHFGILFISGKNYASSPYRIHAYNNIYLFMCKYVERLYEKATSFYQVQLGLEDWNGLTTGCMAHKQWSSQPETQVGQGGNLRKFYPLRCVCIFIWCMCVCWVLKQVKYSYSYGADVFLWRGDMRVKCCCFLLLRYLPSQQPKVTAYQGRVLSSGWHLEPSCQYSSWRHGEKIIDHMNVRKGWMDRNSESCIIDQVV